MNLLRKIPIVAAGTLVGLSLCGCNQQGGTLTAPPAAVAQSTPQMMAQTSTNNPPSSTPAPSSLPEATIPTFTNSLLPATPISVTI